MNEAKMKAKLAIHETTEEGPSTTNVSETESLVEDLPAPTSIMKKIIVVMMMMMHA